MLRSILLCCALVGASLSAGCSGLASLSAGSGSMGSLGSMGSVGSGSLGSLGGGARGGAAAQRQPLVPAGKMAVVQDFRIPAQTITSAELTRTSTGYLLRATGTPPAAGSYNADLVPTGRDGATLGYALRLQVQPGAAINPRGISAARRLSPGELAGVRNIRISGAGNAKVLTR